MRWWLEDIGWIALAALLLGGMTAAFVKNKWGVFTWVASVYFVVMAVWYTVWLWFHPLT